MRLLRDQDREAIQQRLSEHMDRPVTLKLFTQKSLGLTIPGRPECHTCDQTQQLLQEVVELSPHLELEVHDFYGEPDQARSLGVVRIPAIILSTNGESNLKYYGIPSGYEFALLLEDIVSLSRDDNPLKPETLEQVQRIDQDIHIQVFVTPT